MRIGENRVEDPLSTGTRNQEVFHHVMGELPKIYHVVYLWVSCGGTVCGAPEAAINGEPYDLLPPLDNTLVGPILTGLPLGMNDLSELTAIKAMYETYKSTK